MINKTIDFTESLLKKNGSLILGALVFLCVILFHIINPVFLSELENRTWDWRAERLAKRSQHDHNIKIVAIDQTTLNFFSSEYALTWPFPREIYAHVIDYFAEAEARGVAFDILFTESSAQSPEGDRLFGESIKKHEKLPVTQAVVLSNESTNHDKELIAITTGKLREQNSKQFLQYIAKRQFKQYSGIQLPVPELIQSSDSLGYVQTKPDSDGIFRKHHPLSMYKNEIILSLPFSMLNSDFTRPNKKELLFHSSLQELDKENALIVRLHQKNDTTYERFSFAEIIQSYALHREGKKPTISPEHFKDSWIFIGATAPGLLDFRPTSTNARGDGVEFLANTLDSLIHANFIVKPDSSLTFFFILLHIVYPLLIKEYFRSFNLQIAAWAFFCFFSLGTIELSA